ncbi:MAG: fumarylacetoacetate hydrolase family protein [Ilumatobacter sp.]|uniref:fumarylacetoacetate hydrolase family protein n=1 Tax=Ilumatobacter sp. TaxID=1967498 RepID=UPI00391B8EEF
MRLLTYHHHDRDRFGAVVDIDGTDRVVDLTDRFAGVDDLSALLSAGLVDQARQIASTAEPGVALDAVEFRRTLPRPGRIFCIGVNYGGRNAEYRDGQDEASKPSVFIRFASSFVGHGQALVRPPESEQLDYEGEIVAVIGVGGRRIPRQSAIDHLAGLTLGNEGTIRDWVRHAKFNVTQGKNWDDSGAIGPWLVTMDDIGDMGDIEAMRLTTHVNGELRQDDTPATMAFPLDYQIAYLSTFCTLEPGDVIFTGTPTGAGARFDPPRYLVPGDTVEVAVDGIGALHNHVRDE